MCVTLCYWSKCHSTKICVKQFQLSHILHFHMEDQNLKNRRNTFLTIEAILIQKNIHKYHFIFLMDMFWERILVYILKLRLNMVPRHTCSFNNQLVWVSESILIQILEINYYRCFNGWKPLCDNWLTSLEEANN